MNAIKEHTPNLTTLQQAFLSVLKRAGQYRLYKGFTIEYRGSLGWIVGSEEYDDFSVPFDHWEDAFNFLSGHMYIGITKEDLIKIVYPDPNQQRKIDTAIPMDLWDKLDSLVYYVYDYNTVGIGELVDLRTKVRRIDPIFYYFILNR